MTPTGSPHIGNFFGMMQQTIALQDEKAKRYFFVSDQHTFTSKRDPEEFRKNQRNVMIDWLALGIDIEKTVFFTQSDVRAHTELAWYLNCITPMGLLERAHAFKDKTAKGMESNVGLFTYPVLMTADILLYDVTTVPVGKDQQQHVEMARDIAQRFNHHYGETFVLPEARILEDVKTIPGLDGAKMSKSYGNTIPIFTDEETLKKKVMSIQTDSIAMGDPIDPDCTVMQFHNLFENPNYDMLVDKCKNGDVGFGDLKKELVGLIWEYFTPARERRIKLEHDETYLRECMMKGAVKANEKAEEVLGRVRDRMGLGKHISPLPILNQK